MQPKARFGSRTRPRRVWSRAERVRFVEVHGCCRPYARARCGDIGSQAIVRLCVLCREACSCPYLVRMITLVFEEGVSIDDIGELAYL